MDLTEEIVVFWFRRDLRYDDNAGLFQALQSGKKVLPVFIFDRDILDNLDDKADRRVDYIHRAVLRLQDLFKRLQSSMLVYYDKPLEAFKKMTEQLKVAAVYTNHDYEPYAIQRDAEIEIFLEEKGIAFHSFKDQVLFEKSEVVKPNGDPYTVFTPYMKKWKAELKKLKMMVPTYASERLIGNLVKVQPFTIPTLEEMGFQKTDLIYIMAYADRKRVKNYHLTRNIPSAEYYGHTGVHLRFGTLSIRKMVRLGMELNEVWLNQLIWREFFMMILYHFPRVVFEPFKIKYENIRWRNNEEEFDRWCKGMTGYPIVDAGMRQLNRTGFMHNRVRMITASFLCKHLLIDYRWGEAYFAQKLLDFELSSNNGNWQWAAGCGCDAAPYFRVFSPDAQTKRFDPKHKYIDQYAWDRTSKMYPKKIVEHKYARERALEAYREALQ